MIITLFSLFLKTSILASFIILFVLILTPFLNKHYFMRWKYRIWLLLCFYLCFPINYGKIYDYFGNQYNTKLVNVTIPTIADVANNMITTLDTTKVSMPINETLSQATKTPTFEASIEEIASTPTISTMVLSPLTILSFIWLVGVIVLFVVHSISYFIYQTKLKKHALSVTNVDYLNEFYHLLHTLQIKKDIPLLVWSDVSSPMMIGFFKPCLILPNETYSMKEIHFILKHELLHYKRHDIYGKLLFVITKTIHWFNPIISLMCKEAVIDMEFSCDEAVINESISNHMTIDTIFRNNTKTLDEYDIRKNYAETLLNTLATQNNSSNIQDKQKNYLSTQFYGGTKIMKKRFQNILSKTKKRNGIILVLLTFLCIVGCQATSEIKPIMYIERAKLSKEEANIAKLLVPNAERLMFDFITDSHLQSYQLNCYKLIDNNWNLISRHCDDFSGIQNRMVLEYGILENYMSYSLQNENNSSSGSWSSVSNKTNGNSSYTLTSTITLEKEELSELIYDKEIPLLIQFVNPKDELAKINDFIKLEDYFTPEKFSELKCENIYALTLTVSQKTEYEIEKELLNNIMENTKENNSEIDKLDNSYLMEAVMEQSPILKEAIITLNEFIITYFTEEKDDLIPYLIDSYGYNIETYPYKEPFTEVSEIKISSAACSIAYETEELPEWSFLGTSETNIETEYKNLLISGINIPIPNYKIEDGYILIFSIPIKPMPFKEIELDYKEYLTIELIRQNEDWKIQFYGLKLTP